MGAIRPPEPAGDKSEVMTVSQLIDNIDVAAQARIAPRLKQAIGMAAGFRA